MTPDYQFYHGALLHEIITCAGSKTCVELRNFHGRGDAFVFNGAVGLLIKHSASRLTPWTFTFSKDHVGEIRSLRAETRLCFIGFICGDDGFACVRDVELVTILSPTEKDVASVRIERRPRKMYRVSSGGNELSGKLTRGVADICAEITQHNTEYVLPSSEK
jgi:hypothetical protein